MTKYIIGEIFSSGRASLYKNPSDQTVYCLSNILLFMITYLPKLPAYTGWTCITIFPKVAYLKSVLEKFSGSHDDAKSKMESTLAHVQTWYCHSSLGTKMKVERIGDIMYIDDSFFPAECDTNKVLDITRKNIDTADLMIYATADWNGSTLGFAGCIGCVCDAEIGQIREDSSRNWHVVPYKGGRHNANVWRGDVLSFAGVSYKNFIIIW